MFFVKHTKKILKPMAIVAVLLALTLSLTACLDIDAMIESLIGAESQSPVSRPQKEEQSGDDTESSVIVPDSPGSDFEFVAYNDTEVGAGLAVKAYLGAASIVKIPAYVNGTPVLAVYKNAFVNGTADESGDGTVAAITEIIVPDTVVAIENAAFSGCNLLGSIVLPFVGGSDGAGGFAYVFGGKVPASLKNVCAGGTVVADEAFSGCTELLSIELTQAETIGNKAFSGCSAVESIVLPKTVTAMGTELFEGCTSIKNLTLPYLGNGTDALYAGYVFGAATYAENYSAMPQSLTNLTVYVDTIVPDRAFYECNRLKSITIKGNIQTVATYAFYGCKRLEKLSFEGDEGFGGVDTLGNSAFANCSELYSLNISDKVEVIPTRCFYGCASLRVLNFGANANKMPNTVTVIGNQAFAYCESLITLELSDSLKEIDEKTFLGCAYLSKITVPAGVTAIGDDAFNGCTNLKSVTFAENSGLATLGNYAFSYCTSLKEIALPKTVTSVGEYAFAHCWSMKTADLPKQITAIPDGCFFGCTYLTGVSFDNNAVTTIGASAFYGCERLEKLALSDKITSIGNDAFDNCNDLVFAVKLDSYAYKWLIDSGVGSKNLDLN